MSVIIKYNGQSLADLDLPTPQFSRSTSEIVYGEKRGLKESISLDGQVYIKNPPANCDYFSSLTGKRDQLLNIFSENYKNLVIEEDGVIILSKPFCDIISIDFPESPNRKVIEYSIKIECIDEEFHNEFFGIEDPINSTSFALSEDGKYTISRSISARGLKISSGTSTIQNAIDFVESNSGKDSINLSIIESGLQLYLKSKTENIDRIKNSFAVTEEYIADKNDKNLDHGVLTYTVDSSKNAGQTHEVTVSGLLDFGIEADFSKARDRIKEIDFYVIAEKSGVQNLIKKPLSSNINENEKQGVIEFNFVYNNDTSFDECGVSKSYNFSVQEVGSKIVVNVSGAVSARGPIGKRWELVKNDFYQDEINNIYQKAQENVSLYFNGITLNENYESKSITENEKLGTINFDFSFSNKNKIDNFKTFNYNIDMELRVPNISVDMNFGGAKNHYTVSRSGFTKPIVTISANGEYTTQTKSQAETQVKEKVETVLSQFQQNFSSELAGLTGVVKSENSQFSKNKKIISYSKVLEYFDDAFLIGKQT